MNNTSNTHEDNVRPSINRETYRTIRKMSLVEFRSFLFRYTSNLGSSSDSFDSDKLMQDLGTIKGVGEKTAEEVSSAVRKHLGCMEHSGNNNPFRTLVNMAKEAQKAGVIKGILVVQLCASAVKELIQ